MSPQGDVEAAARYYHTAADLRNPQALWNLGWMYQWGIGVPFDPHLAKRHYDSSAEAHPDAKWPAEVGLFMLRATEGWTAPGAEAEAEAGAGAGGEAEAEAGGEAGAKDGAKGAGAKKKGGKEGRKDDRVRSRDKGDGSPAPQWWWDIARPFIRVWKMNPDWDFPGAAARAAAAAARGGSGVGGGAGGGTSMMDELLEFDTLLVIGLTTVLLMVLQLRRHQQVFEAELRAPAQPAAE